MATDPEITRLVDTKTIYARPMNNPDGSSLYHLTAQTLRSTVRPNDTDGDGLLDEDAGEDLDGDGFIRQMRRFVSKGKGNTIKDPKDPKGRAMRRVRDDEGDYEVHSEGVDSDGDGRYNEDGIGGLDLHRNYPENWRPMREETGRGQTQGGAGEYPLSEPETRAVFLFLMTHPNVAIVQLPRHRRADDPARALDQQERRDDVPGGPRVDPEVRRERLEMTGYPWAGDTYDVYATRGGVESADRRSAAADAALRPRSRIRLLLLRRRLVRQRNLERRALRRLRQGRSARRVGSAAMERREPRRQGRFQGVVRLQAPDARRRGDRRLQPEVLRAEPSAGPARNLGAQRSDVQPLPGRSSSRKSGLSPPPRNRRRGRAAPTTSS